MKDLPAAPRAEENWHNGEEDKKDESASSWDMTWTTIHNV